MENNACEKLILDYCEKKLKTHTPEQNIDILHNVDVNYDNDKMKMLMFPTLFEDEYSYVARNSSGGKNSPDINYIDKNTEWFSFCKPVLYGGFKYKTTETGELVKKPKTIRPYRQFREGDLLTIWQTLGAGGAEHLLCVIVHKGQLYSFGFGYQGLGEKQQKVNPRIASVFSKFIHIVDVHPGSIYTPDYLYEIRMYDQILKKRTQLKLIANSYLMPHHIIAMRKDFDQIDFYKDDRNISKISCRLLPGNIFDSQVPGNSKMLQDMAEYFLFLVETRLAQSLEDPDQLEMAAYLISNFVDSVVTIDSQIKLDETTKQELLKKLSKLIEVNKRNEQRVAEQLKPYLSEMKKSLDDGISQLKKASSTDDSPRLLCFVKNLLYMPSARYCEWSSQSSSAKNLANCASFMYRFFGDILTCSGSSLVFHPKNCMQNEGSIKSNCRVSPFS